MSKSLLDYDVIDNMVANYRNNRPLLEGAMLYRGSRLPDQTQGSFSGKEVHGTLMPHIAVGYTHAWQESTYLGMYDLDREKTRFYANFTLEKAQQGEGVKSYSVADAERGLMPYVKAVAEAPGMRERFEAEQKLEAVVKKALYEAPIALQRDDGSANEPKGLFLYRGKPDVSFRKLVHKEMEPLSAKNEWIAKNAMYKGFRNSAGAKVHAAAEAAPRMSRALRVMATVSQREFARTAEAQHGHKPLKAFLEGVRSMPASDAQQRLGQLAELLGQSAMSGNPLMQAKAEAMAQQIAELDPETATYADIVRAGKAATTEVSRLPEERTTAQGGTRGARVPEGPRATSAAMER